MTVDVKQVYEEISADEGKVLHAYLCSEHHKTVGIGHKVLETDAENRLYIYGAGDDVADGNWEELPQEAQHILVNMCFRLGQGGLSKFKNFKVAIEDYQWQRAAEEMLDSRWAKQTPERAERLKSRMLALADA